MNKRLIMITVLSPIFIFSLCYYHNYQKQIIKDVMPARENMFNITVQPVKKAIKKAPVIGRKVSGKDSISASSTISHKTISTVNQVTFLNSIKRSLIKTANFGRCQNVQIFGFYKLCLNKRILKVV